MEDSIIVEQIYDRDENGLLEMKNKYQNLLFSLSYQVLNNNADAEECVNDVYKKVWDCIPPYKPNYFKSFICKIARQISINRYHKNKAHNTYSNVSLEELDYQISNSSSIEEESQENELVEKINEFLRTISKENQVIFIHRYFLLETSNEVASKLGLSVNYVNVKSFRIRKQLLKYLEGEGYYYEKQS